MPSLDERVAYLEGRLEEHASTVIALRGDVKAVHADLRAFREEFRQDFTATAGRIATRIDGVEKRIDGRIDGVERRIDGVDRRLERLDDKMSRHFSWLVGIQVAVLIAVLGALLGR